ncbi:MAG: alanine racemase [Slackia sp.]|nr:alanine racemase [Slackia sp.]
MGFNAFSGAAGQDFSDLLRNTPPSRAYAGASSEAAGFSDESLESVTGPERRWSWVEIDLSAIRHNIQVAKRRLAPGCRLMAVVKANAYGHGAVQVAKIALSAGASQLAVATVNEGVQLRRAGIDAPILVLSEPPASAIPLLLHHRLTPSVYTPEFAIAYGEAADRHGVRAPFHLALNTGMNRIGVRFDEAVEFVRQISFHRALEQLGTFTHFATADCAETLDFHMQLRRFKETVAAMRAAGIDPGLVHCANSAAILRYPETHMDMARLGISMYGFHPCPETRGYFDLRPAMSVHARITAVNTPPMSEGVSYGMNYRSTGSVKICTIPVGYADGYVRALSGRTSVVYAGHLCRQVGNICMDQCMFEVDMRSHATHRRLDPHVGDEVLLVGAQSPAAVSIEDLCDVLGTIPHELCCAFSLRMPKVYLR